MNSSIRRTVCLHLMCSLFLLALPFRSFSAKIEAAKGCPLIQAPLSGEEIQDEMKKYLGVRYKRAGDSRKGFDCSGFVKVVYRDIFGIDLPHQSSQQSLRSEFETISLDSLQTGDLVFFSSNRKKTAIDHVGIYLSEGKFIHATRSKGVVISDLANTYWRKRLVSAKGLAGRIPAEYEKTVLALDMPVDHQNSLSFRYEKRDLFESEPGSILAGDQFHNAEFSYANAVHPALTSNFTVFRESILFTGKGTSFPGDLDHDETGWAYMQGVRMGGTIKPSENLYVIPSLSFFDYGPSIDEDDLPQLALGLTFNLLSSQDGWSLSTDLRMPLRRYSALDQGDLDHSLNLSLTYRQQLSRRVHLSITGDNFLKFTSGLRTPSYRSETEDQHIGLLLHFFY